METMAISTQRVGTTVIQLFEITGRYVQVLAKNVLPSTSSVSECVFH